MAATRKFSIYKVSVPSRTNPYQPIFAAKIHNYLITCKYIQPNILTFAEKGVSLRQGQCDMQQALGV